MKRVFLIPILVCAAALVYGAILLHAIGREATQDEAQPSDAIVVFGAAEYHGRPSHVLRARLDHALELYRRGLASRVIITGGSGGEWPYTEAGVGRAYLEAQGVSAHAIALETQGISTADSVERVSQLMRAQRLRTAIVVSDGYHMFRIKRLFAGQGITVFGSPRRADPSGRPLEREWMMVRQAVGYTLWKLGLQP